jgi:hypothetical protein
VTDGTAISDEDAADLAYSCDYEVNGTRCGATTGLTIWTKYNAVRCARHLIVQEEKPRREGTR